MNTLNLAESVADARIAAGFRSRNSFAKAVGISQTALTNIEEGGSTPGADVLFRIAEASGRSVDSFFGKQAISSSDIREALAQVRDARRALALADQALAASQELLEAAIGSACKPNDATAILSVPVVAKARRKRKDG